MLFLTERITASQLREKLAEMPSLNYALLKYLFKHFKSVEKYENDNSMNSGNFFFYFLRIIFKLFTFLGNIAICCGIGLFSGGDEINVFENDIGKCNLLCKNLIDYYYQVFESS